MRLAGVWWNRSRFQSRGLLDFGYNPIDLQFDGDPAHRNALENQSQQPTAGAVQPLHELLSERLSGPGDPQCRVHGHRPRHGLVFIHVAVPTGRSTVEAATLDPRLFRVDQVAEHGFVGHRHRQTAREQRLSVHCA